LTLIETNGRPLTPIGEALRPMLGWTDGELSTSRGTPAQVMCALALLALKRTYVLAEVVAEENELLQRRVTALVPARR